MRLSTKARYGLRLLLDLALTGSNAPVHLQDVARRQGISKKYLEHIAAALAAQGFVRSVRGAKGGFLLAKPPPQIRVLDVVRALEGPISITNCVTAPEVCERSKHCVTRRLWTRVNTAVEETLANVTLHDLVLEARAQKEFMEEYESGESQDEQARATITASQEQ